MSVPSKDLSSEERRRLAARLVQLLTDQFALVVKIQGVYWNLCPAAPADVRLACEEQMYEGVLSLSPIAEHVRALGRPVPSSVHRVARTTCLPGRAPPRQWQAAVEWLLACIGKIREGLPAARYEASGLGDATAGRLLRERDETLASNAKVLAAILARHARRGPPAKGAG